MKPTADQIIQEFNELSAEDQRQVYNTLAEWVRAMVPTNAESGQMVLWKDILVNLVPNQYIQNYQEIWRLESILGSDTVREALRTHQVLNTELIEHLFKEYPYSFYVTRPETYLFSNYGDISEANGGPLKEITALDALQRYGLEKMEESIEKRYVCIE